MINLEDYNKEIKIKQAACLKLGHKLTQTEHYEFCKICRIGFNRPFWRWI